MVNRVKITDSMVDRAAPKAKDYWIRDSQVWGFCLKVTPAGGKTWNLDYVHKASGKNKRHRIGDYPSLSTDGARNAAMDFKRGIGEGRYPGGFEHAMTFGQILDHYESEIIPTLKSQSDPRNAIKNYLRPDLGDLGIGEMSKGQLNAYFRELAKKGVAVTVRAKAQTFGKSAWNTALEDGLISDDLENPFIGTKKQYVYQPSTDPQNASSKVLTPEQRSSFFRTLVKLHRDGENPFLLLMMEFRAYCGARITEVVSMQETHVLGDEIWFIPEHKTAKRSKKPKLLPVNGQMLRIIETARKLKRQQGTISPFIFPGAQSMNNRTKIWKKIRELGDLPNDFAFTNLRHTVYSTGAASGLTIEQLLPVTGSTDAAVVRSHYLKFMPEAARASSDKIANTIAEGCPDELLKMFA